MLKLVCKFDGCVHRKISTVKLKRAHAKLLVMEQRKRESLKTELTRISETFAGDIKQLEAIAKEVMDEDENDSVDDADDSYFVDPDVL